MSSNIQADEKFDAILSFSTNLDNQIKKGISNKKLKKELKELMNYFKPSIIFKKDELELLKEEPAWESDIEYDQPLPKSKVEAMVYESKIKDKSQTLERTRKYYSIYSKYFGLRQYSTEAIRKLLNDSTKKDIDPNKDRLFFYKFITNLPGDDFNFLLDFDELMNIFYDWVADDFQAIGFNVWVNDVSDTDAGPCVIGCYTNPFKSKRWEDETITDFIYLLVSNNNLMPEKMIESDKLTEKAYDFFETVFYDIDLEEIRNDPYINRDVVNAVKVIQNGNEIKFNLEKIIPKLWDVITENILAHPEGEPSSNLNLKNEQSKIAREEPFPLKETSLKILSSLAKLGNIATQVDLIQEVLGKAWGKNITAEEEQEFRKNRNELLKVGYLQVDIESGKLKITENGKNAIN